MSANPSGMMRALAVVAAFIALTALPRVALAVDPELKESIRVAVKELAQGLSDDVEVSVLPSNGHFPPCSEPRVFLPRGRSEVSAGRQSVGVRCGQQQRVRYVPVRIAVHGRYFEVAEEVRRGDTMDAAVLAPRRGDLGQLPAGTVGTLDAVVGHQASRRLTPGTVLLKRHIRRVPLVERGQRVVVEHPGAGFLVTREGKAMGRGSRGDKVRVRFGRREIISATVKAKGRLGIN